MNTSSHGNNFRSATCPDPFSRASLQPSADFILSKINIRPNIGIICGSGLGELASLVSDSVILPYSSIPGFPVSTAPGHSGKLVFGSLSGASVVLMQGRLHVYEGHPMWRCTLPVRIMRMVGVTHLIVTNAVGGLNPAYQVGDIMLVKDHINMFSLAAESPLRGPNDESFGPRFFSVNDLYSKKWRNLAKQAAEEVGIGPTVHEGVLTISGGPNYESVAELKMFSMLGVDCVGMSSIPESLVAHHCGMSVLAFSLITNQCHLDIDSHTSAAPNHEEVLDAAEEKKNDLKKFVSSLVQKIDISRNVVESGNGVTNGYH
eukprot:GFUD01043305.1.p1 GENE.GFUD01043305.1~~GFUD01043305.1.p1  ORF type:complete len:317 (-),score=99.96 GFUD01043305.1:30-980(-)